jgi:hypothetical protein
MSGLSLYQEDLMNLIQEMVNGRSIKDRFVIDVNRASRNVAVVELDDGSRFRISADDV